MNHEIKVFRTVAFPLDTFDYLKDFQRAYLEKHGVHLNNNQVLAIILRQHRQFADEIDPDAWMDD